MNLNLITCNIRFDNPADGQNSWQNRRDFLSETLLKYSPDIIATQEGRIDQLKDLEVLLKDFQLVDQHRSWIKERMYPTIFIRKGKFEFLNSGDLWLSETPEIAASKSFGSAFPRLMTWAEIQVKNSERKFLLINTHLDHLNSETRLEQIKVLCREAKRFRSPNSYLIITGDFNDSPTSEVRQYLMAQFELNDAWKMFHETEQTSHHAFKGEFQNGSRIDWILTDTRLTVVSSEMDRSVRNGMYPTDHFPIACTIEF